MDNWLQAIEQRLGASYKSGFVVGYEPGQHVSKQLATICTVADTGI